MADEKKKDEPLQNLQEGIKDLTHIEEAPNRDLGYTGEKAENVTNEKGSLSNVVPGEGKALTTDEVKNDTAKAEDTLKQADETSDPTDWKSKYEATQKLYDDLQKKYSTRFSGVDRPVANPDEAAKKAMDLVTRASSGNKEDFDSLFEDEGSANTVARLKEGYNPKQDPMAASRFPSQTQSTAPTYYGNDQTPQSQMAKPDLKSQEYLKAAAGSTAGTPENTDFDDLFEDVKKKGISW